jgi:hypothetical protein
MTCTPRGHLVAASRARSSSFRPQHTTTCTRDARRSAHARATEATIAD